jgi:hypothetical protein
VSPVGGEALDQTSHLGRQDLDGSSQDVRELLAKEASPLPDGNTPLEEKGPDLIDDTSALADQPFAHPVQCLQVELLDGLRRHELHRWTLDRLGNCLRITEVVLLPFGVRADILCRHHSGIVTSAFSRRLR